MSKLKKTMIIVGCIVLICAMFAGCAKDDPKTDPTGANKTPAMAISTEYGELAFPEQWSEFLTTQQETVNGSVKVAFTAVVNEKAYPLFTISIGGEADGHLVGKLTDSSGTSRDVYMNLLSLEMDASLSEGEQDRLYAMQEDVNYLIDNLK